MRFFVCIELLQFKARTSCLAPKILFSSLPNKDKEAIMGLSISNTIIFIEGLILSVLLFQPVNAQWSNDLNENTTVSLFTSFPTLVPGNDNSVIVFSQSRDVQPLLRAQRIGVDGSILWPGPQGGYVFRPPNMPSGCENIPGKTVLYCPTAEMALTSLIK